MCLLVIKNDLIVQDTLVLIITGFGQRDISPLDQESNLHSREVTYSVPPL